MGARQSLHGEAASGDLEAVQSIIRLKKAQYRTKSTHLHVPVAFRGVCGEWDNTGKAPLHLASTNGHASVISALLNEGCADLEGRCSEGRTPICYAVAADRVHAVKTLIRARANISVRFGTNCLSLLHMTSSGDCASLLISEGFAVDTVDAQMRTPLHVASRAGRLGVVRALLDAGANIDAMDMDGDTPLRIAQTIGQLEVADFLLSAKADS